MFKLFSTNYPSPANVALGRYRERGQSAPARILLCLLSDHENNRGTYVKATCALDADYSARKKYATNRFLFVFAQF